MKQPVRRKRAGRHEMGRLRRLRKLEEDDKWMEKAADREKGKGSHPGRCNSTRTDLHLYRWSNGKGHIVHCTLRSQYTSVHE